MQAFDFQRITEAPTAVDAVQAVISGLQAEQTISADVAGVIRAAIDHQRVPLEAALARPSGAPSEASPPSPTTVQHDAPPVRRRKSQEDA